MEKKSKQNDIVLGQMNRERLEGNKTGEGSSLFLRSRFSCGLINKVNKELSK